MKGTEIVCGDCGKPAWLGSEETDSIKSHCICEDKRVKCDCCKHEFLRKDMSLDCMFLALCKVCNEHERHLMDNMAVARFKPKSSQAFSMLCVETIGDKLQLTIRVYHLGISIIFPGMTKKELVSRWIDISAGPQKIPEADSLFDTAFLRLIPEYMTKAEIVSFRKEVITTLSREGVFATC